MDEKKRSGRTLGGLIADKTAQLRWAGLSSIALVLPASLSTILAFTFLAIQVASLKEAGDSSAAISRYVITYSFYASLFLILIFGALAALNFILVIRTSSKVIGPLGRLESQLEKLVEGQSAGETVLRSGDYLEKLSQLINQLSRINLERPPGVPPVSEKADGNTEER